MQSQLQLFISYRRIDSAGYAGRIYENLANRFRVFFDTEGIPYGHVFPDVLRENVEKADICLVIIGKESCREFQKRVDGVDYVVEEIYHAHITDTLIIPILIEGAMMPDSCLSAEQNRLFGRSQCLPDRS